jgi:ADP-ribosylglycohydrolase
MIIGPVGLINGGDPFRAAMEAWDISSLWNKSYSRECAAAMAACHAEAIRPSATIESIVETARKFSPTMKPYIDKAMDVVSSSKDADDFTERYYATCLEFPNQDFWGPKTNPSPEWSFGADPLEVCTEALAFFALAKTDGRKAITGAVNFGRDCDTIAGIAAAFCGALNGPDTIPADWQKTIIEANPQVDIFDYSTKLHGLLMKNLDKISKSIEEMRSYTS